MEYLERVSAAYRDFFYYDETPLLVVDSSEIDFVADPGDLETCCAKSIAPARDRITTFHAKVSCAKTLLARRHHSA